MAKLKLEEKKTCSLTFQKPWIIIILITSVYNSLYTAGVLKYSSYIVIGYLKNIKLIFSI